MRGLPLSDGECNMKKLFSITLPLATAVLLASLMGPVASRAQETVFPGGTLNDLQLLSPTLTFDHLRITGPLTLPTATSVSLTVNRLTITSAGSVGYTYETCEWSRAPDFSVSATGLVVIDGDISLTGRYGTRTVSGAACNRCYGQDGGDVQIEGDEIVMTGDISNRGGNGSTSVSGSCSTGCSGGDAGAIHLEARNIALETASLTTRKGEGGEGFCYGNPSYGSDGDPGPVDLLASDLFEMSGSSISTDGTLILTASQTDIYGPIQYGAMNENIGGETDGTGPEEVDILSPRPDSTVTINEPLQVRIRLQDSLTGVREVQVTGLGYSALHSGTQIVDGVLTVNIPNPTTPPTLQVTARDNKGQETEVSVPGLSLAGDLTIADGETFYLDDDLDLGSDSILNVQGTLIIRRGSNPTIAAGSLTVVSGAQVLAEEAETSDDLQAKAPSLTVSLSGSAVINGSVDLSGSDGFSQLGAQDGEQGGDFSLTAASVEIGAQLRSYGGDGRYYEDHLYRGYGASGGDGGVFHLASGGDFQMTGSVWATGGNSCNAIMNVRDCYRGRDGGRVLISYNGSANLSNAVFFTNGGQGGSSFYCQKEDGATGWVLVFRQGMPVNGKVIRKSESELNNALSNAQFIFPFVQVDGFVAPNDQGDLSWVTETFSDDFEDLYLFELRNTLAVDLVLDPDSMDVDLDLHVVDVDTMLFVSDYPYIGEGLTESIDSLLLSPGTYLICVSQWGDTPADGSAYTLTVTPSVGIDYDGDGMFDWWEEAFFGSLGRNGASDWDGDGLVDVDECSRGTNPRAADSDGDRMPDGWEVEHGLDPLHDDANEDSNGNGRTNLQEYMDTINPRSPGAIVPAIMMLLDLI